MHFILLDTVIFHIPFQNGLAWLLLLLFLFLFAAIVTGSVLQAIGKMVLEKDETGSVPDPEFRGRNIKLIPLTFRRNTKEFKDVLSSLPPKSVSLLQQWFHFDYWFMASLYPFMLFLVLWLRRYTMVCQSEVWLPFIWYFGWLVLAIAILDILENAFALSAIKNTTASNVNAMRVASILKWLAALVYTLPVLSMLLYEAYLAFKHFMRLP